MNGLLYFLLGFITGGFIVMVIMCCIQINRFNELKEYKNVINKNNNI